MRFYEIETEKKGYLYMDYGVAGNVDLHCHNAMELLIVDSGEREVFIGGESRVLKAGEGCFCSSFCMHAYFENSEATAYAIVGDKRFFEKYFSSFNGKVPPVFFKFKNIFLLEKLYEIFKGKKEKTRNDGSGAVINEGIIGVLLGAIAENNVFCERNTDKQSELVFSVLKYAHNHLESDLSLNALSTQFHYSARHLSRVLYKHLSEPWLNYINRIRVLQAHELLKEDPSCSVLEIAFACGFNSMNTFYRAYKKEFSNLPRT